MCHYLWTGSFTPQRKNLITNKQVIYAATKHHARERGSWPFFGDSRLTCALGRYSILPAHWVTFWLGEFDWNPFWLHPHFLCSFLSPIAWYIYLSFIWTFPLRNVYFACGGWPQGLLWQSPLVSWWDIEAKYGLPLPPCNAKPLLMTRCSFSLQDPCCTCPGPRIPD